VEGLGRSQDRYGTGYILMKILVFLTNTACSIQAECPASKSCVFSNATEEAYTGWALLMRAIK